MTISPPVDLNTLSYANRQILLVSDDAVVEALRNEEAKAAADAKSNVNWQKVADAALSVALGPGTVLAVAAVAAVVKAWARAKENGLPVLHIGTTEAARVRFPPGHPRRGVLYVGHPAIIGVYHTMADFHRVVFEHKLAEAVRLLSCLGARSIAVEHVRGWSQDLSARISAPVAGMNAASAETGTRSAGSAGILFRATLKAGRKPFVPEGLVWYPHESTWEMIALARLESGLSEFALSVAYDDDYGVNASLKTAAGKVGLDLGGRFEDHQATVWRVSGEFHDWNSGAESGT